MNIRFTQLWIGQKSGKTNHSEYLALRGIPNDSFIPLDRNIAISVDLFLYENETERKETEVKCNATASVL